MVTQDKQFKRLREKFAAEHSRRTRSLEAHMNKAKEFLEVDLAAGGIHHTPISARLKDQQKALRTLERRNEALKELQDLRAMVEARGLETWEEYCRVWNMEDKLHETKPFTSVQGMFDAMHDLAGIRISLYFPDDVQRVVDLIGERFDIIDGPNRKGGLARDFQKIRKLVEEQRQGQGAAEEGQGDTKNLEVTTSFPDSPFGGYRATHVVIRHRQDFDPHVRGDDTTNIEVQIGSIIMHAWSDIEHDILYKPSHTGKASPDVMRMLGLINGIVMTGEVALQQLASVSAAESTRKVEDRTQKAMGARYMTPWLDKYFMDRKQALPLKRRWTSTGCLYDVLQATDEHSYGRLEELLNQMNPQPSNRLPVLVLHHLGRDTYPFRENIPPNMDPIIIQAWSARYWATCLVNTLNLATYMGTGTSMFDTMTEHTKKDESLRGKYPTFAEFLDILHPTQVQRRPSREDRIIRFCRAMLATTFETQSHSLAAMKLASAGYVACPRISATEEQPSGLNGPPMFVPAKLKCMTPDTLSAFRIMLSTIDESLRSESDYLCFIPRSPEGGEANLSWKPVIRQSGKWTIIRAPFDHDTPIQFEKDSLQVGPELEHLRRALGVKMEEKDVRGLRKLAQSLHIDEDEDQLRLIVKLSRILGTTKTDKIKRFKDRLDAEKVTDEDEITMLAELDRAKEIAELDDIKRFLQLSRAVHSTNLTELRVYRQLEKDHNTQDIRKLKKLRNAQKKAERDRGRKKDVRLVDNLNNPRDTLSDDKSGRASASSDNED